MITFFAWFLPSLFIALVVYAYAAYPIILRWLPARTPATPDADAAAWPLVSIVVPAYKEAHQIRGEIDALVAQTYPPDRRQILILSDASSDRTDAIVGELRRWEWNSCACPGARARQRRKTLRAPLSAAPSL